MASSLSNVNGSSSVNYNSTPLTIEKSQSVGALFSKLSSTVGASGKTITKNQVENYVAKSNSSTSGPIDRNLADFSGRLLKHWDTISRGDESITQADLASGMSLLELKQQKKDQAPLIAYGSSQNAGREFEYGHDNTTVITSFDTLAAAVGASGNKVTKDQLLSYLESLTSNISSNSSDYTQIAFIKNLIAKFDTLSGDGKYITSLDGINEPQDYETITKEQVTPPIDIRI